MKGSCTRSLINKPSCWWKIISTERLDTSKECFSCFPYKFNSHYSCKKARVYKHTFRVSIRSLYNERTKKKKLLAAVVLQRPIKWQNIQIFLPIISRLLTELITPDYVWDVYWFSLDVVRYIKKISFDVDLIKITSTIIIVATAVTLNCRFS